MLLLCFVYSKNGLISIFAGENKGYSFIKCSGGTNSSEDVYVNKHLKNCWAIYAVEEILVGVKSSSGGETVSAVVGGSSPCH